MVTTMLIVINDYNDNKNKIKCMFGLSLDVNECVTKPCRNSGTCENLQGSYRCKCKAGFLGKHCEIGLYACHFFSLTLMLLFLFCCCCCYRFSFKLLPVNFKLYL